MSSTHLDLPDETKELYKKHKELKEEFSRLFSKKQEMLNHDKGLLTALYLKFVGRKKYEQYCLEVELSRLKQELSLLQAYVNRNEAPDIPAVSKTLDKMFVEFQEKIEEEAKRISAATEFLKGDFLSSEETKQIKDTYYYIVKKLHPDVNPAVTEEMKELFLKAQLAYEILDIQTLKQIFLFLNDEESVNSAEIPTLKVKDIVEKLEQNVLLLKNQIAKLETEFPFNMRENLKDEEWIKRECEHADNKIAELKPEIEKIKEYIKMLKEWKPELQN